MQPGILDFIKWSHLGCGQQSACVVEHASLHAGLGAGEGSLSPPRRVASERDGALQERRRGG